jgi:glycosyl transferase family 25
VYLINLARSTARLAATGGRLDELGLKWKRVDAFDGRALGELSPRNFDESAYRRMWGKRRHANEVGCYLSHVAAMRAFLTSTDDFALILEDGALLPDDLPGLLQELLEICDRWDVVKLDSRHWGMPVTTRSLGSGRRLVAYTQRSTGAAAYVLSRKAAQSYVRKLLPMKVPYDHAFDQMWRFGLRMRGVLPTPITTGGFPSDIGYDGKDGSQLFLYRRLTSPFHRGAIEVARALHYLANDPVWFEWLIREAFRSGKAVR